MHTPITVNYVPDGEDWTVTVTDGDEDQTQRATASGLIAARDQADQLVEKMVPNQTGRTVVHLLEGDALAFTNSYLQVRLGLTTPAEATVAETPAPPVKAPLPETSTEPTAKDAAPTPSAPAAEEPAPAQPPATIPPSADKPAELADVPAQGANQAS